MFVVEVGSVLTTILFFTNLGSASTNENVFAALVAVFLWFTVLFANFAEAVAEGRGKAQADTLRKTRSETMANRRRPDGSLEEVPGHPARPRRRGGRRGRRGHPERRRRGRGHREHRRVGDHRRVGSGDPRGRRRPLGGHRRDARALRPDRRAHHGPTGRDVHRPDDRPRRGLRAPEDPERDRAQHPARRADDHLPARDGEPAAVRDLRERRAVGRRARRAAGVPDPDDDRRAALGDRHRRHGPAGAPQRARDERSGGGGRRRREHAAARQDRHDHLRRPPGRRAPAGARASTSASSPTPRCSRAWPTRRRRGARSSSSPRSATAPAARACPAPSSSPSPRRPG